MINETQTSKDQLIDTVESFRAHFPILQREVNGKPLIYLDNGATAQKPRSVIDKVQSFYTDYNANIHRGVHHLSQLATAEYEATREKVAQYINSSKKEEIIFTKGTTDGINLVAHGFMQSILNEGDEVLITGMEHHSNIVPWQIACEKTGATLKHVPVTKEGTLDLSGIDNLLNENTKIFALVHVSNTLGTINAVKDLIEKAHELDVPVLLDGAQSVPHMKIDVQELDCEFYVFSGHKIFGPTGIGVLHGKEEWLDKLPPYQGGGDMIKEVTLEKTTYNELPHKFEAGTPNIAGGIGLGAAIDFMNKIDFEWLHHHEQDVLQSASKGLKEKIDGIRYYGTNRNKASVLSFNIDGLHPYDVGTILDKLGIAVRTGHHCTQPLMQFFDIPGTIRASFAGYNTKEEVDTLIEGVERAVNMLR